jgi:hypothetical protein
MSDVLVESLIVRVHDVGDLLDTSVVDRESGAVLNSATMIEAISDVLSESLDARSLVVAERVDASTVLSVSKLTRNRVRVERVVVSFVDRESLISRTAS